jgi:hypothetical protein
MSGRRTVFFSGRPRRDDTPCVTVDVIPAALRRREKPIFRTTPERVWLFSNARMSPPKLGRGLVVILAAVCYKDGNSSKRMNILLTSHAPLLVRHPDSVPRSAQGPSLMSHGFAASVGRGQVGVVRTRRVRRYPRRMYPITTRRLAVELGHADGGRRVREFLRARPDLFPHQPGQRWLLDKQSADLVRTRGVDLWGR